MGFEFASRASKGARSYQEDSVAVHAVGAEGASSRGPDGAGTTLTAVLADGMGGHAGGARASELACTHFLQRFLETAAVPDADVPARLQDALDTANGAILRDVTRTPSLNGMGCTIIGAALHAHGLEWVSVGDSPLFLVRGPEILTLNEDHSLAPEIDKLAAAGKISWDDAYADPRRHFLRSALTGGEIELVDRTMKPFVLQAGDVVVLASDGIHTLFPEEIRGLVGTHAGSGAGAVAQALIDGVTDRRQPYQDNTTVIVVRVR